MENSLGETPLHSAAYAGNILAIEKLLELGADINVVATTGTPLERAKSGARTEAVEFLRAAGATE